jgi:hypothetical protein
MTHSADHATALVGACRKLCEGFLVGKVPHGAVTARKEHGVVGCIDHVAWLLAGVQLLH